MATARELLQQADALMRRNRLHEAAAADPASDFPVLTDVFAVANDNLPGAPTPDAQAAAKALVDMPAQGPVPDRSIQNASAADVPVLSDIVDDFDPISIIGAPADPAEAAPWPDFDDGELPEPEAVAGPEPVGVTGAEPEVAATSAPVPPPDSGDPDAARWVTLAEDVRMQVLQRIDIFTDTGLQEQLAARLQPIVDRASADLVATINQQVGQLLRGYVAEAIEREIEKWRHDSGA